MDTIELQRIKNKYDIIGSDPMLNHAIETAVSVAPTDLTVLITGESGTGKDVIPQIRHQNSLRRTGKYLAVNCGAIPEGTINAELFGHEKGAFTGAVGERKGYFEEANGGTLFLDEIGELPKETQALLLRVLQNGEYIKVGSSKVEKTDVRVIAATNVNLSYAVATGKFREDLYYRLSGIQIQMPSLRERNKDDVYLLFRKFSSDFAEKYKLSKLSLNHEAIHLLTSYRWPGNIRQLKNIAETVTAMESKPLRDLSERVELGAGVVQKYIPQESGALIVPASAQGGSSAMSDSEKEQIIKAILYLKGEVDSLKNAVKALSSRAPSGPGPEREAEKVHFPSLSDSTILTEIEQEEEASQAKSGVEMPEDLNIRKINDELIRISLEKHGGRAKEVAEELGISERTVYRRLAKIKGK